MGVRFDRNFELQRSNNYKKELKHIKKPDLAMEIIPNPSHGNFQVKINSLQNSVETVQVFNLMGTRVLKTYFNLTKGTNLLKLDLSNQSNGVYLIRIGNSKPQKIVKISK